MPPERSAETRKPKFATSATIPTIRLHLFGEPVPLGRDPSRPRVKASVSRFHIKSYDLSERSLRHEGLDWANSDRQPRRAAAIAATSIFCISIIASNARFASSPPAASASVNTRGVICQETPHLSLHQPHALSWPPLPTIAFQ